MNTPTPQELLALAKKLNDHARECNFCYNDWAADMSEAAAILREFAAAPSAGEPDFMKVAREMVAAATADLVKEQHAHERALRDVEALRAEVLSLRATSAGAGAQEDDTLLTVDLHAAANTLLQVESGKMPREPGLLSDAAQVMRQAAAALATPPAIPGHPVWCAIHAGYFCSCLYVPVGLGGQATPPAGETRYAEPNCQDCRDGYCNGHTKAPTGETPQGEAQRPKANECICEHQRLYHSSWGNCMVEGCRCRNYTDGPAAWELGEHPRLRATPDRSER